MRYLKTMMLAAALAAATSASAESWTLLYPEGGAAPSVETVLINSSISYKWLAEDAAAKILDAEGNIVYSLVRDDITVNMQRTGGCNVSFEIKPPLTIPGTYTLSVPADIFSNNDQTVSNEAFEVQFGVTSSSYQTVNATWECVSPENGTASSLEYLELKSNYAWDRMSDTASGSLMDSNFQIVQSFDKSAFFAYQGKILVTLSPAVTTPGDYMLVLNEGSFICSSSEVTNARATLELKVENSEPEPEPDPEPAYDVTTMPEDGQTVSTGVGIYAIYITVDGYGYSSANTAGLKMQITKDGAPFASVGASALGNTMNKATVMISLPENAYMKEAGEYIVSIPEGFYKMSSLSGESLATVPSPAILLHYTLAEPGEPLTWTIEPESGSEVSELSRVTINFSKPVKVAYTPNTYLFFSAYSNMQEGSVGHISVSDDGLTATIDFEPVFSQGGIYQLRLFEGEENLSVLDGEPFPGLESTYKVNAPLVTECVPAAGSELESIQETKIKILWNKNIEAASFAAWYVNDTSKVKAELTKVYSDPFDTPYFVVSPEAPISDPGEWTLMVEEGSLTITNFGLSMPSPAISEQFKVSPTSGVTLSEADSETFDIYNMQGILVKKSAVASDFSDLPAGLYISNGRKLILK